MRKLLTVRDLQELLKLSRSQIYELARAGDLPCYKIGRSVRFDLDEIEEWLKSKRWPRGGEKHDATRYSTHPG
jgi:putative molybdopterin biosynthesis protein